jgi:hypothetical protein
MGEGGVWLTTSMTLQRITLMSLLRWQNDGKDCIKKQMRSSNMVAGTLLKQGHPEILKHYGLESKDIQVTEFEISTPVTLIGGDLHFSYYLHNQEQKEQAIRLEYGLYYRRQNGTLSKKVFKISEKVYQAGEKVKVSRKQSFFLN